jgi:hypothetical protein
MTKPQAPAKTAGQKKEKTPFDDLTIPDPKFEKLERAVLLLRYGLDSVRSLYGLYSERTKRRGSGAPTHRDQDLLRAMVVMAGAALDASLKQVCRDTYAAVLKVNSKALEKAKEHVRRYILERLNEGGGKVLAAALLSDQPQSELVNQIIENLVGQSLQSLEQISKVGQYFGLDNFPNKREKVKEALNVRNQIVHEMDAVPQSQIKRGEKKRRQRKKDDMVNHARVLLEVGVTMIKDLDKVIGSESMPKLDIPANTRGLVPLETAPYPSAAGEEVGSPSS